VLRPPDPEWLEPAPPEAALTQSLQEALRLPYEVCALLVARGLTNPDDAKAYLRPELSQLHDPAELADGPQAAERIAHAVRTGEKILVHGDYDVDGICSTALLCRWLEQLGANVDGFVPHRLRDGYDFSAAGLSKARDVGAALIVTADCGTVAHETIAEARAEGIDVVVTDHHTVPGALPPANAVVNPNRPDCSYPEKGLCGAGLAYKVCQLVGRELGADVDALLDYLDLVALATVADLVPLKGENRVLVRFGLRRFPHTRVPGVRALLESSGVDAGSVTAGNLGYTVAPRINAAGRIGESADALRLLRTEDLQEARGLAEQLETTNRARQEEDRRTLDEALEMLTGSFDPERDFGVVLAGEGWHPGVIGIVASRVVERVHRPVVLLAIDEDSARGSARSVPGFHLYDALAACSSLLRRFGGHKQAAGMDVARSDVDAFRRAFNAEAERRMEGQPPRPTQRTDLDLDLSSADLGLVHWLEYLGPHGMGNARPVFVARGVELEQAREVGTGHLKVTIRQGAHALDAIGFGLAVRHPPEELTRGVYDVVFRLERNEWRGVARVQANLVDLRLAGGSATP
jgi:single-stranded-DNA-specific exonuclease